MLFRAPKAAAQSQGEDVTCVGKAIKACRKAEECKQAHDEYIISGRFFVA